MKRSIRVLILTVLLLVVVMVNHAASIGYTYWISNPTSVYNVFGETFAQLQAPLLYKYRMYSVRQSGTAPSNGFQKLAHRAKLWVRDTQNVCFPLHNVGAGCTNCFQTAIKTLPIPSYSTYPMQFPIGRHKLKDSRAVNSQGNPPGFFYTTAYQSDMPVDRNDWLGNNLTGCLNNVTDFPTNEDD